MGIVAILTFFVLMTASSKAQESFSKEPLTIETSSGKKLEFSAELATTDGQRQQGLMFRKSMAPADGMLFDFGIDREVTMWMRNTLIPLDMVFISKDGKVTHVHANAVPHSEDIISSRGPVRFVLELNGGTAGQLGIDRGDTVRSKQIGSVR
ncbi:signal peptide protein [Agrobacterium tumefaciens]|uniref:Signal peptide protein n=1 Tax=Agrobacterium tumefaciens TaxID=358 RepID=A0A0D0J2U0_AGRTU|nr:signal peptide protein [Agrobacterium tumefaciens]